MNEVPRWFMEKLAGLFSLYPGMSMQPVTYLSWWQQLKEYPREVIETALARIPSKSENYIPNCTQVKSLAGAINRQRITPMKLLPPKPCDESVVKLADDNPFMQLAKKWEDESRQNKLNSDLPTPKAARQNRMKEMFAMLDGKFNFNF
jgi:hypothetical protein